MALNISTDLTGTSAVITGGASGLGYATAQALVEAGAQVVVIDLPDAPDSTSRADAVAALGEAAQFHPGDVTDPQTSIDAVAAAAARGPLRTAVSCAGVATPGKLLGRKGPLPAETFMKVLAINTGGTVNLMTAAAAVMAENELAGEDRGVLINTASVAAFDGQIGQIAYSASKGAVASLTLPAARELAAHAIRVVTIAPGLFETPMMAGLPEDARESLRAKTLHPARLGKPEDYAQTVLQIIANPMLNGETIRLDGAIRLEPK
ncbi:SDR family NAD(P)-dependent oxidoreductase [Nesterenkonia alkaliphila]|uniref:SDR family NAD(P)-dependent oxidoreductase n=1 Tax=Nesterenkonia alkaliphila TaxID=1463631 RepID=A0A7K1UJT0_9MICC|nr:SDR family NAD(P)-dependent oxidoreductase [Nesterenkonia alkaliphila]MVT26720.1 SDR family NAD(P)-dependent oxidoreductase [Nesterenkonia alkaliphila]GFZ76966.1 3-hydroxyacyl-CoA dehydrogenase [Nesterenkonia alkaliphila]